MKQKSMFTVRYMAEAGIIAAIYFVLTIINPLAFGPVQVRFSEALCVLPFFTPAAVPGLFIGCLLSNLAGSPLGIYDIVFGSLATLAAALLTYYIGRIAERKTQGAKSFKWLLPLPAVVINAFVVAAILSFYLPEELEYWITALYVGVGQAIACYVLGIPLFLVLNRYRQVLFKRNTA